MYAQQDLSSGDIVLSSGRSPAHQRVQAFLDSPWSQTGLILKWPVTGELVVLESSSVAECTDVETGRLMYGVQVVRLADRLRTFDGVMAVRQLQPHLSGGQEAALLAFQREISGRPYNNSKYFLMRAALRRNTSPRLDKLYCSQLVAEAFQRVGVLAAPPEGMLSGNYVPSDFAQTASGLLPLMNGFRLDSEIVLAPPMDTHPFCQNSSVEERGRDLR